MSKYFEYCSKFLSFEFSTSLDWKHIVKNYKGNLTRHDIFETFKKFLCYKNDYSNNMYQNLDYYKCLLDEFNKEVSRLDEEFDIDFIYYLNIKEDDVEYGNYFFKDFKHIIEDSENIFTEITSFFSPPEIILDYKPKSTLCLCSEEKMLLKQCYTTYNYYSILCHQKLRLPEEKLKLFYDFKNLNYELI